MTRRSRFCHGTAGGAYVELPPPPPPGDLFVSTPATGDVEVPMAFDAFAAAFKANTLPNGTYRVLMGGQARVIDVGTNLTITSKIRVIPDIKSVDFDNPLGEGPGTTYPSKFLRALTIKGLLTASDTDTWDYIEFQRPDGWPDWVNLGQKWADLGIPQLPFGRGSKGIFNVTGTQADQVFNYCRWFGGYGPNKDVIVEGYSYPDTDAPATYYGNGTDVYSPVATGAYTTPFQGKGSSPCRNANKDTGLMYDVMGNAPPAFSLTIDYVGGVTLNFCDIESVTGGRGFNAGTVGKPITINGCTLHGLSQFWFQLASDKQIQVNGMLATGFYKAAGDLGEGHPDLIEAIGAADGPMPANKYRSLFYLATGASLAQLFSLRAQPTFPGSGYDTYFDGVVLANALVIGGANGAELTSVRSGYCYAVSAFNPPWQNAAVGGVGQFAPTASLLRMQAEYSSYTQPYSIGLIENCFAEGIEGQAGLIKSSRTANQKDAAAQSAWFGRDATIEPTRTPAAFYNAFCLGRPGWPWAKISDALKERAWAHLPVHCFFVPAVNVAPGSAVTSPPTWIFGPDGASYPATMSGGATVEIRSADTREADGKLGAIAGTQLAAPSTTPTMLVDRKAVAHVTAPATAGTCTDYILSFGGRTFPWRVTTASANRYPKATVSNFIKQRAGGLGTSSSQTLTVAALISPSQLNDNAPAQPIFGCTGAGGANINVRFYGRYLHVYGSDAAGHSFGMFFDASAYVSLTAINSIIVTIDLSQSNVSDGVRCIINGRPFMPLGGSGWNAAFTAMDLSGTAYLLKDLAGNVFAGDFCQLFVTTEKWPVDQLQSVLLDELNPDVAGIGANIGGKLMSPTARRCEIAISGKKTLLESTAGNDGTLTTGWSFTGTVTQKTDATWPL